jgi:hypothetical protein
MLEGNRSPSESRDLVVLEPDAGAGRPRRATPPQAAFLAQLIASAGKVPQFSDKRRAMPREADAAYHDVIARIRAQ